MTNPLLAAWNTPFDTPPFSSIRPEHYEPAIRHAMEEGRERIQAIAGNEEPPTFENTIEALEQSSPLLDRATALLFNLNECDTNEQLQQIAMEMSPLLARYSNDIYMNAKLFERVASLYERRDELPLDVEQQTLLERTYRAFVKHGARLGEEEKKAFAQCSEELASLTQLFNQHVLADTNEYVLHLTRKESLKGLPSRVVEMARDEARSRGLKGWVVTLHGPSYIPFMTYAESRPLRRMLYQAYNNRGHRGNENDNNATIFRIVELRLEMARLLGYDDYASYALSDKMAGDVATVRAFMERLKEASLPAAKADLQEVQDYARRQGADFPIQKYDFSYYSELLRKEKYDFDSELLRPYFPLEKVRQGIFDLYHRLYGLSFVETTDVESYHPEAKVYKVTDGERWMGLLYLDMHPRASKRGGAWMTEFRGQHREGDRDVRPLIQVVCNFSRPVGHQPALLSFGEVETFMHEMGHAMHGMLSDVRYESLSGTNVLRDFVEMPSQVMENWCYEPEFLNSFARHFQTGETIPTEYVEKIRRSQNYLSGWLCLRQLNLGNTDLAFHTLHEMPKQRDAALFEHQAMTDLLPPMGNTATAFTHIFAGGYAAGYYGYKWAEALDADIFSHFKAHGIFDSETAARFRRDILSRGGTEHPSTLYRRFMGRDPNPDALIERSGFKK